MLRAYLPPYLSLPLSCSLCMWFGSVVERAHLFIYLRLSKSLRQCFFQENRFESQNNFQSLAEIRRFQPLSQTTKNHFLQQIILQIKTNIFFFSLVKKNTFALRNVRDCINLLGHTYVFFRYYLGNMARMCDCTRVKLNASECECRNVRAFSITNNSMGLEFCCCGCRWSDFGSAFPLLFYPSTIQYHKIASVMHCDCFR